MKILGIETSADDTGVALIETSGSFEKHFSFKILGNALASQTEIHQEYGGIYPNLAKREHNRNLPLVLKKALADSEITTSQETNPRIDAIAVTVGPGLEPCLWQGITLAQKLAKEWEVPVVATNHMEGHILISMMEFSENEGRLPALEFPALALLVSGGHTELILIKAIGEYEYIGRTRDDAVGEAFDKVARTLGLPYPGGPEISRLAETARKSSEMTSHWISLPRPMMHENSYEFSFSGLKTAVARHIEKHSLQSYDRERIAREFEDAVTDVLVYKTLRAVEEYGVGTVIMGGGVSANKHIRLCLAEALAKAGAELSVCPPQFSTDNGLMIALAGASHALKNEYTEPKNLTANGNLKLC